MKSFVLGIGCFFMVLISLSAQVSSTVDSTSFVIGDQTAVQVTATLTGPADDVSFLLNTIDSSEAVEFVEQSAVMREANNPNTYRRDIKVAFFDTGSYYIPQIPIVVSKGGQVDTFLTQPIPIRVSAVQDDAQDLAPIKPIIREGFKFEDIKYLLLYEFLLLAFVLAIVFYMIRRRRRLEKARALAAIKNPLTPLEWALATLQEIEDKGYTARGEFKAHYAALSLTLRQYIERALDVPAAESTTQEIADQLRRNEFPKNLLEKVLSELRKIDLIKYAKAPVTEVQASRSLNDARLFVRQIDELFHREEEEEES